MRLYSKLLLFYILTLTSCTGQGSIEVTTTDNNHSFADTTQKVLQTDRILQTRVTQSAKANSDTLIVKTKTAVIYEPTDKQIAQQKKEREEYVLAAGTGDYVYYINNCMDFLNKQGLRILNTKDKRFIKFILQNQTSKLVKLDTLPMPWGVFLFDPIKMPQEVDMTDIEEEYKNYFQ